VNVVFYNKQLLVRALQNYVKKQCSTGSTISVGKSPLWDASLLKNQLPNGFVYGLQRGISSQNKS